MSALDTDSVKRLFHCIASLESEDECRLFFEDLCTVKEVLALSQRMEVARLLRAGGTYHETIAGTGASSATISRVKNSLNYGAGGYKLVLERLSGEENT